VTVWYAGLGGTQTCTPEAAEATKYLIRSFHKKKKKKEKTT
jgi:hypothetical protein